MSDEQPTREIMDKIYAMTPEEFSDFMHWNWRRLCAERNAALRDSLTEVLPAEKKTL